MAIRSADQISIIDLTDGYSVMLSSDGYTFPGTTAAAIAGSCTTTITALCGSETVAATVDLNNVVAPTGITVTKDTNATTPTLTITASTSFTTAGVVDIPVQVGTDIIIHKHFAVAIAFQGTPGTPGTNGTNGTDGEDAIVIAITSSNGTIFKNTAIATTLTAHVYKGGTEITGTALSNLGTIKWYKDGGETAVATGATLNISAGQVTNQATYIAQLETA